MHHPTNTKEHIASGRGETSPIRHYFNPLSARDYRRFVFESAMAKDGKPIYNGSLEHAAVVIEALFNVAERKVSILTGNLNPRVYSGYEIMSQAIGFLSRNSRNELQILKEDDNLEIFEFNAFIQVMKKFPTVSVRNAPSDLRSRYRFHFVVADCNSYRFEQDRDSPSAIASFGDNKGGSNLCSVFDTLWKMSTPVALSS